MKTKKDKLIEYVMKADETKWTALHQASSKEHEGIVKFLLNAFNEEKKDELIEYVMKGDDEKMTALYHASNKGHEGIVKLLLNAFNKIN